MRQNGTGGHRFDLEQPPDSTELVAAGVKGYLCKTANAAEIAAAVIAVADGLSLLSVTGSTWPVSRAMLTMREREVLRLVTRGCRNVDIGAELRISVNTVEYHMGRLFSKLKVGSRWELIAQARGSMLPAPWTTEIESRALRGLAR